jgi:hypothetical protein
MITAEMIDQAFREISDAGEGPTLANSEEEVHRRADTVVQRASALNKQLCSAVAPTHMLKMVLLALAVGIDPLATIRVLFEHAFLLGYQVRFIEGQCEQLEGMVRSDRPAEELGT